MVKTFSQNGKRSGAHSWTGIPLKGTCRKHKVSPEGAGEPPAFHVEVLVLPAAGSIKRSVHKHRDKEVLTVER
jgi:hypothetical protein